MRPQDLPNFQFLGTIPNDIRWRLSDRVRELAVELGSGERTTLKKHLSEDEYPYIHEAIRACGFKEYYNINLSVLAPGETFDWRVDAGDWCRVQIVIDGTLDKSCHWLIKKDGEVEEKTLHTTEMWFTNTTREYQRENRDKRNRKRPDLDFLEHQTILTIGCPFETIQEMFEEWS